ncbi:MAG: efflux RND transporter permease subunit [Gemmatimonadaceae bacterium]|nr:efflux RND transporter permease subunit [Gloeobacterales cyanobacterium ES-bin-141]
MTEQTAPGFSVSRIAIRRHIGTLMLALVVIVIGVFTLVRLPVDLLPSITYPRIGVRIEVPGIAPQVAIDEVTRPLEEALAATEGVVQVFSRTREGQVSIDLYFQPGGDIDQALNDATAAVNRAQSSLPDIAETPRLFKADPSQLPIYEFALTSSSLAGVDLRVFADEELARELSVVPGIAAVDVSGGVQEEVQVKIDLDRLQALGIGITDVLDALSRRNQDISGGRVQGRDSEPLTRTVGLFARASEIRDLSIPVAGSDPPRRVYLREFATVVDGTEDQRVFVSLNRKPAVKVSVQKQPDANTVTVVDGVKARIDTLKRSGLIPADTVLTATLDESVFIRNSLADVTTSGLIGAGLAMVAVLLFLGSLRQTFIIVLAIPLGTLVAVILMGLFGLSLNVFTLGGLAIGIGAVDSCIVVLENIVKSSGTRSRSETGEWIERAEAGSGEVESALVASTTTNLVAVLPFLLIGGFVALLFNELILTISFTVGAALLTALTVVPMLTSRLMAVPWSSGVSRLWLLRAFNRGFESARQAYTGLLDAVMRRRLLVIVVAVVVLGGGSFLLAGQIPQEILPRIATGQANLLAQFPPGTPLATSRRVMTAVDDILLKQPETEYVFSTTGGFLFGNLTIANPLRSSSTITLKPGTDVEAYAERVGRQFDRLNLAGIRLRLSPGTVRGLVLSNSPVRADFDVILQGNDEESLRRAGRMVLAALDERAKLASFRPDADDRQPEVQIRPDWERAEALGLDTEDVGRTVETAVEGSIPTQLQRGNRLVDVRVRLDRESVQRASQLEQLPLSVTGNRQVRLGDVADLQEAQSPAELTRINQRQVFLIAGSLGEDSSLSEALTQAETVLAGVDLPKGVTLLPSSAAQSNRQIQDALVTLGGLAIFLVFVVMAVQYNSLLDPLVIIFTVPLALAGGILGLYVTETAVGATVLIGAVLLVGIVVGNGIILVELANQIREREGIDRRAAMLKAAPERLRPVAMTAAITILGLFPLALGIGEGSELLQPLGIVVFSGLSLATVLTLFIIPCFYTLLHDLVDIVPLKLFKGRR